MKKLALVIMLTAAICGCTDKKPPNPDQELRDLQTAMDEAMQAANEAEKSAGAVHKSEKISFSEFQQDLYFGDYSPDQYPDLNNMLGRDGIIRLQNFEKKAVENLYNSKDCDKPYSNGVSMQRTTPENIVVFFDCNNGNRFYISELDLAKLAQAF